MAKPEKRRRARELRKSGKSIKWIARKLGVSSGSVSRWCSDIILTSEQIEALETRSRDPNYGRRLRYAAEQRKRREEKTKKLLNEGVKKIGSLSERELFLVGAALYWAEGYKKESQAGLGSSDLEMVKIFLRWLRECFGYKLSDLGFRVTANISHEYRIDEIIKHWSDGLGVPIEQFQKPFYQRVKWKKQYDNPEEYYGVLRVRVRKSADFMRKIHGFIEGLKRNS